MLKARNKNRDVITAKSLGMSYADFIERRELLKRQADSQRMRRKVFRILLPFTGEVLTRFKFSSVKSRILDRIVEASGK